MLTWQEAEAESLETKAEMMEAALVSARRLDGLFGIENVKALHEEYKLMLSTAILNLRSEADKLRKEREEVV